MFFRNLGDHATNNLGGMEFLCTGPREYIILNVEGLFLGLTTISIPLSPIEESFNILLYFLPDTWFQNHALKGPFPSWQAKRLPFDSPRGVNDKLSLLSTHCKISGFG